MQQQRLDEAYAFCEAVCRNASTTFYSSFSALNIDKRRAVHAVYALCRWVDDIVDGDADERLPITEDVLAFSEARMEELVQLHGRRPSDPQDLARWRLEALSAMRLRLRAFASGAHPIEGEHPVMRAMASSGVVPSAKCL